MVAPRWDSRRLGHARPSRRCGGRDARAGPARTGQRKPAPPPPLLLHLPRMSTQAPPLPPLPPPTTNPTTASGAPRSPAVWSSVLDALRHSVVIDYAEATAKARLRHLTCRRRRAPLLWRLETAPRVVRLRCTHHRYRRQIIPCDMLSCEARSLPETTKPKNMG